MDQYKTSHLRNLALVGHSQCGKTSLAETALFTSGVTKRQGKTDDGNTVCDYDQDEIKRKISISAALAHLSWKDHKINLIDTPGYTDFIGEVYSSLRAADVALVVVSAVSGVEVQTERVLNYAAELEMPRAVFISKMDKEHANFDEVVQALKEILPKAGVTPVQIPIGSQDSFKGVVDLISMKASITEDGNTQEQDIPEDIKDAASIAKENLIETVAENSDELLEKYLDQGELSPEEIKEGLKKGVVDGVITPVMCGSSVNNAGCAAFLDFTINYLPAPGDIPEIAATDEQGEKEIAIKPSSNEPLCALVFKTLTDPYVGKLAFIRVYSGTLTADSTVYDPPIRKKVRIGHILTVRGNNQEDTKEVVAGDIAAIPKVEQLKTNHTLCTEKNLVVLPPIKFPEPVFSAAVEPKSKGDEEKLSMSLSKLASEDPTLRVARDSETRQTVLSGAGDLHLEIILDRLKRKFSVDADLSEPKIPYKETVKGKAKAQGKYKKQTGGRGQYGDAWIEIEPAGRGKGFEFVDKIVGGAIPKGFIPAVEKGINEAMVGGVIAGYPVVDLRVILYDGSFHRVDSSEMAFKVAGSLAFKKAFQDARPTLLEPIVNLEVVVPEQYMGDVIGNLSGKRGKVIGTESRGKNTVVKASTPLAETAKYASELRSLTHGTGAYSMEFSHYEEVPGDIVHRIIAESEAKK